MTPNPNPGHGVMEKLVKRADVLIQNFRSQVILKPWKCEVSIWFWYCWRSKSLTLTLSPTLIQARWCRQCRRGICPMRRMESGDHLFVVLWIRSERTKGKILKSWNLEVVTTLNFKILKSWNSWSYRNHNWRRISASTTRLFRWVTLTLTLTLTLNPEP